LRQIQISFLGRCIIQEKEREKKLNEYYEELGSLKNDKVTALDYNLRNLEIETAKKYIDNKSLVLDVGSGPGVACFEYAKTAKHVIGIDYSKKLVEFSNETLKKNHKNHKNNIIFEHGSVLKLPYQNDFFDLVTSHRVLIAILSWEDQQKALSEIIRCLKVNGLYIMFEACVEGLDLLNHYRKMFSLDEISEGGSGDYDRLLFSEKKLFQFMERNDCKLIHVHHFGMYYFLTRIFQPLFVAPDVPRYDHKVNDVAFEIVKKIPDFEKIGHLKGYIWKRNGGGK
jgi:ubiquinone/menaquinone biosynthesis C-methylase UbiE